MIGSEIGTFINGGISIEICSAVISQMNAEILTSSVPPPPEPSLPTTNANLWAWFRSDSGVTTRATTVSDYKNGTFTLRITGSSTGSLWQDQSGNGHHFTTSYAFSRGTYSTPYYQSSVVNSKPALYFQGPIESTPGNWTYYDETMLQTSQSSLNSPFTVYLLMNNLRWFSTNLGFGIGNGFIYESTCYNSVSYPYRTGLIEDSLISSPRLRIFNGNVITGSPTPVGQPALNSWHIITCVHNGVSSSIRIDEDALVTVSLMAVNPNGIILGNSYNPIGTVSEDNSEMYVAAMIISSGSDDSTTQTTMRNWLKWYGGLSY